MSLNHELFMRRAIQIARCGSPYASPNPLVGAVIVDPDGRILAEGFHRRCGEAHAEVNAVKMLDERYPDISIEPLTIYVTLEPCAHFGRTPPCAKMLVDRGFRHVVIGTGDPFAKVNGRGIEMLREAGAEVTVGVLQDECRELNRRFFTAHTLHRPYVMLKWAQSADGFMAKKSSFTGDYTVQPAAFSSPLTLALMHRQRTLFDAIAIGANTVRTDQPHLTVRLWPGPSPRPVVYGPLDCICDTPLENRDVIVFDHEISIRDSLSALYDKGITSLMVEGGASLLQSFIDADAWDEARIETAPFALGNLGAIPAPTLKSATLIATETIDSRVITTLQHTSAFRVHPTKNVNAGAVYPCVDFVL